MDDGTKAEKSTRRQVGRSPAYPSLPVSKALEQARALRLAENDYPAPLVSALKAWGYGAKSSGGRQTLATLKYYGLIDVIGEGDDRKIKVSDVARRIIIDNREDDTEKKALVRKVALTPVAHRMLHNHYPTGLASDSTVLYFLVHEQRFNEEAARELLAEFKETAGYIGLFEPQETLDKSELEDKAPADTKQRPTVKIGDRLQWTSGGVDQFRDGARVVGFTDDGDWVFTDQGGAGISLDEVTLMEQATLPGKTPPPMPAHLLAALASKDDEEAALPAGSRKALFPLDEGDVVLIFPKGLSAEGLIELGAYLDIFLKKEAKKRTDQIA